MGTENFDAGYWDSRYNKSETGWDIGSVSEPLKAYIDQLPDKDISILIPGCGNAYEAAYLLQQGFTNVTLIDISTVLVMAIKEKFAAYIGKQLDVIEGDFFKLGKQFDLVLEQTFFCALHPSLREAYVQKMADIVKPGGKLAGVLFNRDFEGGPPFGGHKEEYLALFSDKFIVKTMETCYNSIEPRRGNELFVLFMRK